MITTSREELKSVLRELLDELRPSEPDTVLDPKEAADYLGICTKTLMKRTKEGSVRSFKVGRQIRFRKSDLHGTRPEED